MLFLKTPNSPSGFPLATNCLHPLEIHHVERKEGRILVEASDNITVAKVYVTVFNEQNKIIGMSDVVR